MKKITNRTTTLFFLFMLISTFMFASAAFAAQPKIVSGTQKLISDAMTWLLILIPTSAALKLGYHAMMKYMADDNPGIIVEQNKKMKHTLIGAAIAVTATGLVDFIISYYK